MLENFSTRKKIRWALHSLYNENATMTVVSRDSFSCFHIWAQKKDEIKFPYSLALELINQNLVKLDSGNDYYGEENFVANKKSISIIAPAIRCDVGDTVKCTLKDFDKDVQLSGFVTGWKLRNLEILYINDISIIPSKAMLTRKILIEKIRKNESWVASDKSIIR